LAGWDVLASVAVATILFDQVTKALVLAYLGPGGPLEQVVLVPGLLRLFYVENTGAAFGLFQGRNPVLALLALGVVLVLVAVFRQLVSLRWGAVALGLQLGGAVGNLIDRFRHGFVVDFIDPSFWPTFNVADSAITIGVLLLLVLVIRSDRATRQADREANAAVDAERRL
jgi:signal peptidase II